MYHDDVRGPTGSSSVPFVVPISTSKLYVRDDESASSLSFIVEEHKNKHYERKTIYAHNKNPLGILSTR